LIIVSQGVWNAHVGFCSSIPLNPYHSINSYQIALVEVAKKQNTIVNLGTGQGKTLIALLLIRHFAKAYEDGKQTLFLVPSVAICTQHTTTLQANLPYTVAAAYNNSTKANGAREAMAKANILVATHGAARDLFMHYGELFSFERINLLIVDECHYASGEHGYATILRNFYHKLPRVLRPRVLGLTASPLVNIKIHMDDEKIGEMLTQLEEILDSKLACLAKLSLGNDDEDNQKKAEERCVHYHRATNLPEFLDHKGIGLHESRCKEFNKFVELYVDLGPKLTSIYSATVAREISMNCYEEESKDEFLS
jgi:endoribonuclease Dicer